MQLRMSGDYMLATSNSHSSLPELQEYNTLSNLTLSTHIKS